MIWKILTIIFILMILGISVALYIQQTETYNFKDFKIRKVQLDSISSTFEDEYYSFIVCDIDKDKCIKIGNIG